jgi:hypothetical protein
MKWVNNELVLESSETSAQATGGSDTQANADLAKVDPVKVDPAKKADPAETVDALNTNLGTEEDPSVVADVEAWKTLDLQQHESSPEELEAWISATTPKGELLHDDAAKKDESMEENSSDEEQLILDETANFEEAAKLEQELCKTADFDEAANLEQELCEMQQEHKKRAAEKARKTKVQKGTANHEGRGRGQRNRRPTKKMQEEQEEQEEQKEEVLTMPTMAPVVLTMPTMAPVVLTMPTMAPVVLPPQLQEKLRKGPNLKVVFNAQQEQQKSDAQRPKVPHSSNSPYFNPTSHFEHFHKRLKSCAKNKSAPTSKSFPLRRVAVTGNARSPRVLTPMGAHLWL